MPEFDVNIRGLNANKAKIKTLGGKAVFSKASLDSVAAGLQGCISPSGYAGIKKSLDDASESLKNQIEHLGKLSSGIKQAADTYLKTENAILGRGFTIFGVNIDVGVEGKAAAVGAKAGGSITTGGIQGEIGASLGLGVGINFSIDWSGFRLPWQ